MMAMKLTILQAIEMLSNCILDWKTNPNKVTTDDKAAIAKIKYSQNFFVSPLITTSIAGIY